MAVTITARIWEVADALTAEATHPASRADVVAACVAEGINKSTANTQYGHWKRKRFPDLRKVTTSTGALIGESSLQLRPDRDWSYLLRRGFEYVGDFKLDEVGKPVLDETPPSRPGVYAIVRDQSVVYIGISNRTLRARMNDYRRGHEGQGTSSRINAQLRGPIKETPGEKAARRKHAKRALTLLLDAATRMEKASLPLVMVTGSIGEAWAVAEFGMLPTNNAAAPLACPH